MAANDKPKQASGFLVAEKPRGAEPPDPKWKDLAPLPGRGTGVPMFISNNPEIFHGNGLLAGSILPKQGGRGLSGKLPSLDRFGFYLFHINKTGGSRRIHLLASPVGDKAVKAHVRGALNANAWALGQSASVHTAKAILTTMPIDRDIEILPRTVASFGYVDVNNGQCVDGRFFVEADGGLYVRDVAASAGASASVALGVGSSGFAKGEIKSPNASTGAMGRCAGLYAHDRWAGSIRVSIPRAPFVQGFRFDEKKQAFAGIATFADSSSVSFGNYGSIYEIDVKVKNASGSPASVSVQFASYPGEFAPDDVEDYVRALRAKAATIPTRIWDGHAVVEIDGKHLLCQIQTCPKSPGAMRATLASRHLAAGASMQLRLRIPVPGLISIPAAILVKATGAKSAAATGPGWTT